MDSSKIVERYFNGLSDVQKDQFQQLGALYAEWNQQINVISRKDTDHFYEHHVLHSLGIARIISFEPGTKILDVGTGGGFPGIPLAILFPDCRFHLVDSIGKKIKVVNAVADSLGLSNVSAEAIRAEQVKGKYDFVVSRAVTRMKPFLQWVSNKISHEQRNGLPNGVLYLKGGDLSDEMSEIKRNFEIFDLSDYYTEDFFETKKVVYVQLTSHK
ncbi:16S rRNA (guanine(527)-N(7))-methyltransferase RsmG [Fulvivirga sedimenti]|uniref:Ribosomal RNA small subunit methyltransferase G n=1 Tax=Fulvivirga sedimenti TaxID=2879465 RepID=A0A9X1HKB8_9BACT|nr:16S rRNA (guanine(527)-N(7))-methyltransferase RsmG [Fulvivirga sedimenti]MCA6073723.1 16S rRNA (guanine(527)-N(7))-methyltransferase RsmG [Fulvivirga sedimenti]